MKRIVRARLGTALLATALLLAAVSPAMAAGWPWPLGSRVALGFGAPWTDAAGGVCTHRGIDIASSPGETVRACADGTVAFCGPVPSAAGGRVIAVTVHTADGLDVSYMPLDRANVSAGGSIAAGQRLGTVATDGDGSTPGTHLHLSVRRGDLPLDPTTMLASSCEPVPVAPPPAPVSGRVSDATAQPAGAIPAIGPTLASGAVADVATLDAGSVAARTLTSVRIPASDARAVHSPRDSHAPRLPVPDLRPLALGQPVLATGLGLLAGIASAVAIWVLAQGGPALEPARGAGRGE